MKTSPVSDFVVELGDLASGATATVIVTDTRPAPNATRMTVHANESDTHGANDTATMTTTMATGLPSSRLQVLGLRPFRSRRKGLTAVVVSFDRPMDTARIQDTGIYHLARIPEGKKARARAVRLKSATPDADTHSVMLTLRKPVKTGVLRLTIDHTGAIAADGTASSGGGDWRVAAR